MGEKRYGKQSPTISVVLPYTQSLGAEAVEIYNRSKRRSTMPWQELMLEDIMAVNPEGLWTHMKFGWSIPRRNGKSEILIMRAVWGVSHDEKVLYTAHRTTTSHNAWEKCIDTLVEAGYVEDVDFKTTRQFGLEHIEWLGGGGIINFRTRSSKGGLGEGYDLLIVDEAQEYTADQESALKYVVTSSPNPQTLMCGTPPTTVSSGTVFLVYRRDVVTGKNNSDCGWAEWSVPKLFDARAPELWYETNPSLGYILSERAIRSELGEDQVDTNIQRLGLWLTYSQKSAISRAEWESYIINDPPGLKKPVRIFYGVKYSKVTPNVSLCAAVKTADGKIFIEAIDCRSVRDGNDWIISYLLSKSAEAAAIDGAGNQDILAAEMKDASVKCKPVMPKVSEVIEANALFEKKLFEGCICHTGQPSLTQAAANCEHRPIGSGGGFGYTSILEGADVSMIEAVSLAHWLCANSKEKKKQIITY